MFKKINKKYKIPFVLLFWVLWLIIYLDSLRLGAVGIIHLFVDKLALLAFPVLLLVFIFNLLKKRLIGLSTYLIFFILLSAPILNNIKVWTSTNQGNKIVRAIDLYKEKNNVYPASLEDLVPNYLNKIPKTNIGLFDHLKFNYIVVDPSSGYTLSYPTYFWASMDYNSSSGYWKPYAK